MAKIAVLSDLHGNYPALQAVLEDVRSKKVEGIYCLGDLVGYAPFPDQVIDTIRREGIPTVMGNYDDGVGFERLVCGCSFPDEEARRAGEISLAWTRAHTSPENKAYLRGLPHHLQLELAGRTLYLTHGSPRALNEYLEGDVTDAVLQEIFLLVSAEVLLIGHTHQPFHRVYRGRHLVNAGSVGRPKHGDPHALYCLLDVGEQINPEFIRVPYDYEGVAAAIIEAGLPPAFAETVRTGRG